MDSSKSSERHTIVAGEAVEPRFANRARSRGYRGGVISMHRSMASLVLEPWDIVQSVLLALLFSLAWLGLLPNICRFWQRIFEIGTQKAAPGIGVGLRVRHFTPYLWFAIPYPRMEDVGPDAQTWWLTAAVIVALFTASFLLPKKMLPVTYLLRAALFVQTSALLYFALAPGRFPHTPESYTEGLVTYGIALISLVPILFGLTYYIFNFGLLRKLLLTAMTMAHLSVFFPLQILLQAIVLQKTVLFMPVLYILLGMPVDILVIIAFYSWGMSWPARSENDL